jgi:cathepsin L
VILSQSSTSFSTYVETFNRPYAVGTPEYRKREAIFQRKLERINMQNSDPDRLWTAALNHFSDRTDEELGRYKGWRPTGPGHTGGASFLAERAVRVEPLREEVHWMNTSAAKNVRNQGEECGSCWAFATAAMLKANYELHHGTVVEFSEQDLVNCVKNPRECGGQGGCDGATVELGMDYVMKSGISSTTKYTGVKGACQHSGASKVPGLVGYRTLPFNEAAPLMHALSSGPVAVSVDSTNWEFYSSGVFNSCKKDAVIDHAVLLVGYGVDRSGGKKLHYWTIQNSYGANWGEGGFIRLLRQPTTALEDAYCGTDRNPEDGTACKPYPEQVTVCGMCGILSDSVSVQFDKTAPASKVTSEVHF